MKNGKLFVALPLVFGVSLCACSQAGVHHQGKDYILEVPYHSNFKILQLCDLHLGQKDDLEMQFAFMDKTIDASEADMIVIDGDVFTFANRRVMRDTFNYFESKGKYWSITWGNHDEQGEFSITYMTSYLNELTAKAGSKCRFIDIQDDDVYGYANYAVDLKDGANTKFRVYIFDSNRYYYGDYFGYDAIHQDQIDWYERMVKHDALVPSIAYFHIPVPEFETAYNLVKSGSSEATLVYGENREGISAPKMNTGLFQKMVDLGSTKAILCAHDHVNDSEIIYKGIHLVYGITSTDRIYADGDKMGGLVTTIKDDGSFSFERIYKVYGEEGK